MTAPKRGGIPNIRTGILMTEQYHPRPFAADPQRITGQLEALIAIHMGNRVMAEQRSINMRPGRLPLSDQDNRSGATAERQAKAAHAILRAMDFGPHYTVKDAMRWTNDSANTCRIVLIDLAGKGNITRIPGPLIKFALLTREPNPHTAAKTA